MIQKTDTQYFPCLTDPPRYVYVASAWLGIASRMIVDQYQTYRMAPDGFQINLPGRTSVAFTVPLEIILSERR